MNDKTTYEEATTLHPQDQSPPVSPERGLAVIGFPTIVPSSVLGANAPSNRVTLVASAWAAWVAVTLRIPALEGFPSGAVCDVDAKRTADGQALVQGKYAQETASGHSKGCAIYKDYGS